jgi:transcriptional regulator with XRE-family HTH domain
MSLLSLKKNTGNDPDLQAEYVTLHAEIIKNRRLELKMTTSEVAKAVCLSRTMIESIENGSQTGFYSPIVKFTAVKRVASFLGIPAEDHTNQN